jgi:hypothetical protein
VALESLAGATLPTATQLATALQAIDPRFVLIAFGVATGATRQTPPALVSMKKDSTGEVAPWLVVVSPTAQQLDSVGHDTPSKALLGATAGLETVRHLPPSKFSTSGKRAGVAEELGSWRLGWK